MTKETRHHGLPEMLQELIGKYHLENDPYTKDSLRKKVQSVCMQIPIAGRRKATNLWEVSKGFDGGSKPRHKFTDSEKKLLFENLALREYLHKIAVTTENDTALEVLCTELEYELRAKQTNADDFMYATGHSLEVQEYMDSLNPDVGEPLTFELRRTLAKEREALAERDVQLSQVTSAELQQKKQEIMLEAIFLRYYTAIDEDALMRDMQLGKLDTEMNHTAETMMATERLKDGSNYYKKK